MQAEAGTTKTAVWTSLALVAFAGNSILCRVALGEAAIDAASFTTIRLICGALTLLIISGLSGKRSDPEPSGGWVSAGMLFLYAITFSFAYVSLSTATGALILFGSVQATMILAALRFGEWPHILEWTGLSVSVVGLVYLLFPRLDSPDLMASVLMAVAGFSWGVYSLRGRGATDPLRDSTRNFVRSVPFVCVVSVLMFSRVHLSAEGVLLAASSGALASGVGYVIWYAALTGLSATRAALVQLAVPVFAAAGGVIFLSEDVTVRLVVSAIVILGGVGLAVLSRGRITARSANVSRS